MPPPIVPASPAVDAARPESVSLHLTDTMSSSRATPPGWIDPLHNAASPAATDAHLMQYSLTQQYPRYSSTNVNHHSSPRRKVGQSPLRDSHPRKPPRKRHQLRSQSTSTNSRSLASGVNLGSLPLLPPLSSHDVVQAQLQYQASLPFGFSSTGGSQSARSHSQQSRPALLQPLPPESARSANYNPSTSQQQQPQQIGYNQQLHRSTSNQSLHSSNNSPHRSSHAFPSQQLDESRPMPVILTGVLNPSLSFQGMQMNKSPSQMKLSQHPNSTSVSPPRRTGGHASMLNPLQAYVAPASSTNSPGDIRGRHKIGYKQRVVNQYGLLKSQQQQQQQQKHQSVSEEKGAEDLPPRKSSQPSNSSRRERDAKRLQSSSSSSSLRHDSHTSIHASSTTHTPPRESSNLFAEVDRQALLAYLHSSSCHLWQRDPAAQPDAPSRPTLNAADIHQLLKVCGNQNEVALALLQSFDVQCRKFSSVRLLIKDLATAMNLRQQVLEKLTAKNPRNPNVFALFTNAPLAALLNMGAVDRMIHELPHLPLAHLLKLLETYDARKRTFPSFNELLELLHQEQDRGEIKRTLKEGMLLRESARNGLGVARDEQLDAILIEGSALQLHWAQEHEVATTASEAIDCMACLHRLERAGVHADSLEQLIKMLRSENAKYRNAQPHHQHQHHGQARAGGDASGPASLNNSPSSKATLSGPMSRTSSQVSLALKMARLNVAAESQLSSTDVVNPLRLDLNACHAVMAFLAHSDCALMSAPWKTNHGADSEAVKNPSNSELQQLQQLIDAAGRTSESTLEYLLALEVRVNESGQTPFNAISELATTLPPSSNASLSSAAAVRQRGLMVAAQAKASMVHSASTTDNAYASYEKDARARKTGAARTHGRGRSVHGEDRQQDDIRFLMKHLTSLNCGLWSSPLVQPTVLSEAEVVSLLHEGGSEGGTLAILELFEEFGQTFDDFPALCRGVRAEHEASVERKQALLRFLTAPNPGASLLMNGTSKLYDYAVERLYEESRSGPYALRYLQTLLENGRTFGTMDELIVTVTSMHAQTVALLRMQIQLLKVFLTGPTCKLWFITPSIAQLSNAQMMQLLENGCGNAAGASEAGGPFSTSNGGGAEVVILNCQILERELHAKFEGVKDLIPALQYVSNRVEYVRDALYSFFDQSNALLNESASMPLVPHAMSRPSKPNKAYRNVRPIDLENLVTQSGTGASVILILHTLQASGQSFRSVDELLNTVLVTHYFDRGLGGNTYKRIEKLVLLAYLRGTCLRPPAVSETASQGPRSLQRIMQNVGLEDLEELFSKNRFQHHDGSSTTATTNGEKEVLLTCEALLSSIQSLEARGEICFTDFESFCRAVHEEAARDAKDLEDSLHFLVEEGMLLDAHRNALTKSEISVLRDHIRGGGYVCTAGDALTAANNVSHTRLLPYLKRLNARGCKFSKVLNLAHALRAEYDTRSKAKEQLLAYLSSKAQRVLMLEESRGSSAVIHDSDLCRLLDVTKTSSAALHIFQSFERAGKAPAASIDHLVESCEEYLYLEVELRCEEIRTFLDAADFVLETSPSNAKKYAVDPEVTGGRDILDPTYMLEFLQEASGFPSDHFIAHTNNCDLVNDILLKLFAFHVQGLKFAHKQELLNYLSVLHLVNTAAASPTDALDGSPSMLLLTNEHTAYYLSDEYLFLCLYIYGYGFFDPAAGNVVVSKEEIRNLIHRAGGSSGRIALLQLINVQAQKEENGLVYENITQLVTSLRNSYQIYLNTLNQLESKLVPSTTATAQQLSHGSSLLQRISSKVMAQNASCVLLRSMDYTPLISAAHFLRLIEVCGVLPHQNIILLLSNMELAAMNYLNKSTGKVNETSIGGGWNNRFQIRHFSDLIFLVRSMKRLQLVDPRAEAQRKKKLQEQQATEVAAAVAVHKKMTSPRVSPKNAQASLFAAAHDHASQHASATEIPTIAAQLGVASPRRSPKTGPTNFEFTEEAKTADDGSASEHTSPQAPFTLVPPVVLPPQVHAPAAVVAPIVINTDFDWASADGHVHIKSLQEFVCYPTRVLFQKDNASLASPFKSEVSHLLQQVGPNASGIKHESVQPATLSSVDQERLLRLALFHLEAKGFQAANLKEVAKEIAAFNHLMQTQNQALLSDAVFHDFEKSVGLEPNTLTFDQRSQLYIHSTCGPYLHFHLRCFQALNHRVDSYQALVYSLQSQHKQFMEQRSLEIALLKSYGLSMHCFLFFEQPQELTRYECAQLLEFNTGLKSVTCKKLNSNGPQITTGSLPASRAQTPDKELQSDPNALPAEEEIPMTLPVIMGSENSASCFMYFQLLQQLGCKFEHVSELIAAMRSLYIDQDVIWSRNTMVRHLLDDIGVTEASDNEIFELVYNPLHGGLQSVLHLQVLADARTHFKTASEVAAELKLNYLHSLEDSNASEAAPAEATQPPTEVSYNSSMNLFVFAYLKSPITCHMLPPELKQTLTVRDVQLLRDHSMKVASQAALRDVSTKLDAQEFAHRTEELRALTSIDPLQTLHILYELEEESAVASEKEEQDDSDTDTQRVFNSVAALTEALTATASAYLTEKIALYSWFNNPNNRMLQTVAQPGSLIVSPAQLNQLLDDHVASISPVSILNLAQALSGQGKTFANLDDFMQTALKLQGVQSGCKSLLLTYLASSQQKMLSKSCVIHDADLTALIAAATSGSAALLALQRMERELLLASYTLEAQLHDHRLTAEKREALQDQKALLGGQSMAQLISAVHAFSESVEERWEDVRHFITQSGLIADSTFDVNKVDVLSLLQDIHGVDVVADVLIHLLWLFSQGTRFETWADLVTAMKLGVRNGPANLLQPIDNSQQFYLPPDDQMMIAVHLFGPVSSLLKSGVLFSKGQFGQMITAGGGYAAFSFQHLLRLQGQSVTCTTMKELIKAVDTQQSKTLDQKQQVWSYLNDKNCRLFSVHGSERVVVSPANVNRLFSLTTYADGDLYKKLCEAGTKQAKKSSIDLTASTKSLEALLSAPVHPIAKHGPYRFFSHLLNAIKGVFPHQYISGVTGVKPGVAFDGRPAGAASSLPTSPTGGAGAVFDEEHWVEFPPMYRLSQGESSLLIDPQTDASVPLDLFELQSLLAASRGNPHACSMHLLLLEVMHRRFKSFRALLSAVQAGEKDSAQRMEELKECVAHAEGIFKGKDKAKGYKLLRSELEALYYQSGAGPLCPLFIQEMHEANHKVGSVKELIKVLKLHHQRFIQRRNAESELLHIYFRDAYDFKRLFGLIGSHAEEAITFTDADISQLLLVAETGVSALVHMQYSSLSGNGQLHTFPDLMRSFAPDSFPSDAVKKAVLQLVTEPKSELLDAKTRAQAAKWSLDQVDELMAISNSSADALLQLWALRATVTGFDSLAALGKAVHTGRVACLDPYRAQIAMLLAYMQSPSVQLLVAAEQRDMTVDDIKKLIQLCGGSVTHTFTMLVNLDAQSLQFNSIIDLASEMARINAAKHAPRPSTASQRRSAAPAASSGNNNTASAPAASPVSSPKSPTRVQTVVKNAAPSTLTAGLSQEESAIFKLVFDESKLLAQPKSFRPEFVAQLVRVCAGSSSYALGSLKQLSLSSPKFASVSLLEVALKKKYEECIKQIEQIGTYLNTQPNLTLFRNAPTQPYTVTRDEVSKLFFESGAGISPFDVIQNLENDNRRFNKVHMSTFADIEELAAAIHSPQPNQTDDASSSKPALQVDVAAEGQQSPPLTTSPTYLQSPVARSQRLDNASLAQQTQRFLSSSQCSLFSEPIIVTDSEVNTLITEGEAGKDTLAYLWAIDSAGNMQFTNLKDLARTIRARHVLFQCLSSMKQLRLIDPVESGASIDAFLARLHTENRDAAWMKLAFQVEIYNDASRNFKSFQELVWAIDASQIVSMQDRERLLDWMNTQRYFVDDSFQLSLSDVERLMSESGAGREVNEYLSQIASKLPHTGRFQNVTDLISSVRDMHVVAEAEREAKSRAGGITKGQLSDLAAQRRLQADGERGTPSPASHARTQSSTSFVPLEPIEVRREKVLTFVREHAARLFQSVGTLHEITATDLDRLLKTTKSGTAEDAIGHIQAWTQAGGGKCATVSELIFALVKAQRHGHSRTASRAAFSPHAPPPRVPGLHSRSGSTAAAAAGSAYSSPRTLSHHEFPPSSSAVASPSHSSESHAAEMLLHRLTRDAPALLAEWKPSAHSADDVTRCQNMLRFGGGRLENVFAALDAFVSSGQQFRNADDLSRAVLKFGRTQA